MKKEFWFHNDIGCLLISMMLFAVTIPGRAGENTGSGEYLQPGELTREDYAMISEHKTEYNYCLNEKSLAAIENQTDPRLVVDMAMKECAVILENLDKRMTDRNILPAFRNGYIRRVSSSGANDVLRTVMMGMANKQSATEQ